VRAILERFKELEVAKLTLTGFHTDDKQFRVKVRLGYNGDDASPWVQITTDPNPTAPDNESA
jgi:hypothetical protein